MRPTDLTAARALVLRDFGFRRQQIADFLVGPAYLVRISAGGLTVDEVRPLFSTVGFLRPGFHQAYDVMPDGRFLFARTEPGTTEQTLVQVTNWFAEIRARLRP